MAFFSVLIPVYNQVGKMDACIASLNAQTFTDLEIIMVDDGSTDASYEMLCGFRDKDPRIRVIRQEKNSSLVGARYTGMQNATGEYVFILDSDDCIAENTFEILHEHLIKTRPDVLRFGFRSDPAGQETVPPPSQDVLGSIYEGKIPPAIWKNCYARSVTDKLVQYTKPFYCNMSEDVYFSTVLFTFAGKVDSIDDILYFYDSGTGMSSATNSSVMTIAKFRKSLKDTVTAGEHMLSFLNEFAPERVEAAKVAINRMNRFVFTQHVAFEKDYRKIVECAYEYRLQGLEELYDQICNDSLKKKVLFEVGLYDPKKG